MNEELKMTPELKAKWVEALRSNKYTQGRSRLKRLSVGNETPEYCCLGVLCDIISPTWIKHENESRRFTWQNGNDSRDCDVAISLISQELQNNLINLNDSQGASFSTIADYIEGEVEVNNG